jgi:type VI secretion system protein ImpJ
VDVHNPLFWHQGLFLQPQHFQLLERSIATQLSPLLRYPCPHLWGIRRVEVHEAALNNRSFQILSGEFLFPDGSFVVFPGNASLEARSFDEDWVEGGKPLTVYLGLKKWDSKNKNVSVLPGLEGASQSNTRFVAPTNPEEVPDLHEGKDPALVKKLSYVLRIFWGTELDQLGAYNLIPLARLKREGDQILLSGQFVPPCVALSATEPLLKLVREVKDQIAFRCHQLEEYKRQRGIHTADFGSRDMVFLLALRTLARFVPSLTHVIEAETVHPWSVYGLLRQLIGELSTFSDRVGALGEEVGGEQLIPAYDHERLWEQFSKAQNLIATLLEEITAGPEHVIRLEFDDTFYSADLKPQVFEEGNRYYLVISTEADPNWVITSLTEVAKASSRENLPILIARALPGLGIEHLQVPPQELPRRSNSIYFSLQHHGDQWSQVLDARNIALYWDDAPEDLNIELMIVGRS